MEQKKKSKTKRRTLAEEIIVARKTRSYFTQSVLINFFVLILPLPTKKNKQWKRKKGEKNGSEHLVFTRTNSFQNKVEMFCTFCLFRWRPQHMNSIHTQTPTNEKKIENLFRNHITSSQKKISSSFFFGVSSDTKSQKIFISFLRNFHSTPQNSKKKSSREI